jgi:asparagine N-glycosylation enzyme membrane subunit Stt3
MSLLLSALIALISILLPGFFLALALLKKTKLNMIEITVIGFMFGLIFPPTLTWLESYLMNYVHAFSFSAGLYGANVIILTIIGIALCVQQGVINIGSLKQRPASEIAAEANAAYRQRLAELREKITELDINASLVADHKKEEEDLASKHSEETRKAASLPPGERARLASLHSAEERKLIEQHEREEKLLLEGKGRKKLNSNIIWGILIFLMIFTFATRMMSIGIAPHFFEFDPYFDMQSTEFLLTHGYQWLYDTSAWPTAVNGTPHRIEPIVPYLEAYWYQISNPPSNQIDITLLSDVGSIYPPITAALLVFIVFMFLYHMYGDYPAIIGAGLATAMPALITTFVAGEQLVEPWGIFAMFFFYAAYMLAAQNPKEKRFAILAGIAFASSFLGAHYYTVIAGVFAIYIVLQGVVDVLRNREMRDFYIMNVIVIAVIVLFYIPFGPYGSVLANRIPSVAGIPVIISFPLLALLIIFLFERLPILAKERGLISKIDLATHLETLAALGILALVLILFTPLGTPVDRYIALSYHYTTPSIALFMTVQEYAPTGLNFDFGSAGFGPIGASLFGVNAIVWFVLIVFTLLAGYSVYKRDSKGSILAWSAVIPLAVAGMIEIKYLPHFGVGYILALGIIIGELLLLTKGKEKELSRLVILGFGVFIVLLEFTVFISVFSAIGASCSSINSQGNSIGFDLFCNTVSTSWLNALAWMKQNVGPSAPRVLSWWDYGDWINWFGNSNAVLRGDNSIPTLDYVTAARYVLGQEDGYGPANLASFMNNVVYAKYVVFDNQLTAKWQALDFLACVGTNQTSMAFAAQAANGTGNPYLLGTSQCELSHAPAYAFLPASTSSVNSYCQFGGKSVAALKTLILANNQLLNTTYCAPTNFTSGPVRLLDSNGNETNILLVPTAQFFAGVNNLGGQEFLTFIPLYLPNGPNDTITDAPSRFYNSNYYRAFYLGNLPGFKLAYPTNFTGVNYVNGTWPVLIYELDNYTGPLPKITPKPPWVVNNFTMPG